MKSMVKNLSCVSFLLCFIAQSHAYYNEITEFFHDIPYTEVCFKNGKTLTDIHSDGGSTVGGNCHPGDLGFVIESIQRPRLSWDLAMETCLQNNGMRLPLFFEWRISCRYRDDWGLESIISEDGGWEWVSNQETPMILRGNTGVAVSIAGYVGCTYASWEWVGYYSGANYNAYFRCVK
ncbi:MAG: hypothetical protein OXB84_08245 [Halobacteriovoraceae bacterium]|nr:hypothetical protein [Halobacteriovoraceae bacterium]